MKRYFCLIISYCIFFPIDIFAQRTEQSGYQNSSFNEIKYYPKIKDTIDFIRSLKTNCHLEIDYDHQEKEDNITRFQKFKIYGSDQGYYLVELDWHIGCMASFPWKYQLIFDKKGKLIKVLSGIRFELVKIFPKSNPFLLSVVSTAKGNGNHHLFRIKNDALVDVINTPDNFCVETYDAHEDLTIYSPNELTLSIKDINKDGFNDLIFSGTMLLTEGVTKDNFWYDNEENDGKEIRYSVDVPFRKIPIKLVFDYNPKTETFYPISNYTKYCTDNLYKLIYTKSYQKSKGGSIK